MYKIILTWIELINQIKNLINSIKKIVFSVFVIFFSNNFFIKLNWYMNISKYIFIF